MTGYTYKYIPTSALMIYRKAHLPHIPDPNKHFKPALVGGITGGLAIIFGLFSPAASEDASGFIWIFACLIVTSLVLSTLAAVRHRHYRRVTTPSERNAVSWHESRRAYIYKYDELSDIKNTYVTDDDRVLFVYDLIDTEASTSERIAIKIPDNATPLGEVKDPARFKAIHRYKDAHQLSELEILNLIHDLLQPIEHREREQSLEYSETLKRRMLDAGTTPTIESIERENKYLAEEMRGIETAKKQNLETAKRITRRPIDEIIQDGTARIEQSKRDRERRKQRREALISGTPVRSCESTDTVNATCD